MKTKSAKRNRLVSKSLLPAVVRRSEVHSSEEQEFQPWQALDQWLLWAGISPDAQKPMSHIGIYTDFT